MWEPEWEGAVSDAGENYGISECRGLMVRAGGGKVEIKPLIYSAEKYDNKGIKEIGYYNKARQKRCPPSPTK